MNNDDEFRQFWQTFVWPDIKSISYRLYHDDAGDPLLYTMEDLPGKYVEVTAEQYARASFKVKIMSGLVQEIDPIRSVRKLRPRTQGTKCHAGDIAIVVDQDQSYQYWKKS